MTIKRFAHSMAAAALFYGTLSGVCQSIPAQPDLTPQSIPAAAPAPAHISIKFIATGAKADGQTPKSCQNVLAVMLPYIKAYPHPADWTWFVACDEPAWAMIQSRQGNQVGSGILAITNRSAHSTIIRGSAMLRPASNDYRAQPEHIIAHELCHIYLHSSDEDKVDAVATRWVADRNAKHLAVLEP